MVNEFVIDTKGASGIDFPWVTGQTSLAVPPAGGICNAWSFEDDNSLSYIRYSKVFWNSLPVAANGDPFIFSPSSGVGLIAFSDGVDEAANANTGKQTKGGVALPLNASDTNCNDQGALVPFSTSWFLVQGMGISFGQAGSYGEDGSFEVSSRLRRYGEAAMRELADLVFLSMRYENTKIINDYGVARQYGAQSQVVGGDSGGFGGGGNYGSISVPVVGGGFQPNTFPWFAGSKCSCNLINILAFLEGGFQIDSNTVGQTIEDDVLTIPMTIELYGRTFCLDALAAAATAQGQTLPARFFGQS